MWGFSFADLSLVVSYIGTLAFLEGLFSADNAIVLALMVRHLPKRDQRSLLMWGLWGAVVFRFIALVFAAFLIKFWLFKVIGGAYLLYLAISHFVSPDDDHAESSGVSPGSDRRRWQRFMRGFWGTVISVTLTDIAFSIDSILAAVTMSEGFPARFGDNGKLFIVFTGGVLGIITMRFAVRYFLILLDRFPGLAEGAYCLVAWIGLKLLVSGLHQAKYNDQPLIDFHMPEWLFWVGMILIALISLVFGRGPKTSADDGGPSNLDIYDRELESSNEEPTAVGNDERHDNPDASETAVR